MMSKKEDQSREQVIMISLDDLVPENHLVRALDKAFDYSFIFDLVKDRYSEDTGRPSLDPVILIKIPMIQMNPEISRKFPAYVKSDHFRTENGRFVDSLSLLQSGIFSTMKIP